MINTCIFLVLRKLFTKNNLLPIFCFVQLNKQYIMNKQIIQQFNSFINYYLRTDKMRCKKLLQSNLALEYGSRILSSYTIPFSFGFDHKKLWILTEADRSSTTILFPGDY